METILIVDDDAQIRAVLEEYLSYCGYRVLVAANGDEALEVVDRHTQQIDLVICDVFMPRREGLSTMSEIKKRVPTAKILVMSGGRDGERALLIIELGKQFGAVEGLQKPFELDALRKQIEKLLVTPDKHCVVPAAIVHSTVSTT